MDELLEKIMELDIKEGQKIDLADDCKKIQNAKQKFAKCYYHVIVDGVPPIQMVCYCKIVPHNELCDCGVVMCHGEISDIMYEAIKGDNGGKYTTNYLKEGWCVHLYKVEEIDQKVVE